MVALLENLRREMSALIPRYRSGELQGKDVETDLNSMLVRVERAIAESQAPQPEKS